MATNDTTSVKNGHVSTMTSNKRSSECNTAVTELEQTTKDASRTDSVEVPVTENSTKRKQLSPPNGGWGWIIVFGSLIAHIIIFGIEKSSGIFYLKFEARFNKSAAVTAWITTLPGVFRSILGPLCGILINRFSCRSVTLTGAIILGVSMGLTAFTYDLTLAVVSYSLLGGLGMCLVYSPAIIIVNQYFSTKRGLATGIATSSLAAFLFPNIIEFLFDFYGFLGAFLILSGITLNLLVCGTLYRPLPSNAKFERQTILKRDGQVLETRCNSQGNKNEKDKEDHGCCYRVSCSLRNSGNTQCNIKTIVADYRYTSFIIAVGLFSAAFQSAFAFLPVYAKEMNIEESSTAFIVSLTILFDTLGRLFFGAVLDMRSVKHYRVVIYNCVLLALGILSLILPFSSEYIILAVVCSVYGFMMGCIISQKSVIIVDILGVNNLALAFGLLLLLQGVGSSAGPSISGVIKDMSGSASGGFYFGGICTIFGAAIFATANLVHHFKYSNKMSKGRSRVYTITT
ncbi:monocarboxylate transporter 12-like [Ylistrum balloti]|uniref:monocarboxylate transporter 12-like n=1 Tax=Ylistrum balloti TaxID=509963 RepID=UPI002905EE1A|nr:monocarboxylate transporter 12-like [Ylistrum balloti]